MLFRLLFASVLILLSLSNANAETTSCTEIAVVPVIITVQGVYCFKSHIATSTSATAIEIQTNNVTIDFNHFKLGGLAARGANGYGVYAENRKNITLRNANIRGFAIGVAFVDTSSTGVDKLSGGHIIENSRFDSNRFTGIDISGAGNSVRGNKIINTGGATNYSSATGILTRGPGVEIIDNHVHNTFSSTSYAAGIRLLSYSHAAQVLHNRVSESRSTVGDTYGIYHESGGNVLIQDNQIVNTSVTGTTAINSRYAAQCLAVNNTLMKFTTPIDTCTDGGGNTTF